MYGLELAELIQKTLSDYKGKDVDLVDIRGKSSLADFFVIASGDSDQQVRGLADLLEMELEKAGITVRTVEGYDTKRWILLDYGDVIVHIFQSEERDFYSLEKLWRTRPSSDSMI